MIGSEQGLELRQLSSMWTRMTQIGWPRGSSRACAQRVRTMRSLQILRMRGARSLILSVTPSHEMKQSTSAGRLKREQQPVPKIAGAIRRRSADLLSSARRKEPVAVQARSARSPKTCRATGERTRSRLSRSLDVSRGLTEKARTRRMAKAMRGRRNASQRTRTPRATTRRKGVRMMLRVWQTRRRREMQLERRKRPRKRSQRKRRRPHLPPRRRKLSRTPSPCWRRGMTSEGQGRGARARIRE
mmetsp:Transcript_20738/g.46927  ORF Transcript_20738/g.46927 Transcript_20738/m.46927 type:complete len:244 (+) Transcript_20738:853-1584(+)